VTTSHTNKRRNTLRKRKMSAISQSEIEKVSAPKDPATNDFIMQQTMLRVKDPLASIEFYTKVLGMTLLTRIDVPPMKFTIYFVGYEDPKNIPKDEKEQRAWALSRPATIELTHNWGTENDPNQKYHNGNSEPRGFGHIGVAVPDVYAACKRFDELGVKYVKKPDDGKMKGLAFIQDPDEYWIEIFNPRAILNVATSSASAS